MTTTIEPPVNLLKFTDTLRQNVQKQLEKKHTLEQYFSSSSLAQLMASMMTYPQEHIRILDPGAGVGSLFAACISEICQKHHRPKSIAVTAYEIDNILFRSLKNTISEARRLCESAGIKFTATLIGDDFVESHANKTVHDMNLEKFTHIILNPPYKKINTSSKTYAALSKANLQTVNMYAAFISISSELLVGNGQMTFISPRSFCNGVYFQQFRKNFLETMTIKRIHLFDSRSSSFSEDGILQENVIMYAEKTESDRIKNITISSSRGPNDGMIQRDVKKADVIFDGDQQCFIHIVPDASQIHASTLVNSLKHTLEDIDIDVSTGKVVDFRIPAELRFDQEDGAVPLIRPSNISNSRIAFPTQNKKHPNFIMANRQSQNQLLKNGNYVLVRRFTAREEKKRIVAAVWTKNNFASELVGFENRINYFHNNGKDLEINTAIGLCVYLNCSVVDAYFRQYNGSTQVNATDLRYLRYPSKKQLDVLGRTARRQKLLVQDKIDNMVGELLFGK